MEIIFKTWLDGYKEMNTEKGAVGRWDLWNKTKYKPKVESAELTSEDVARENHNKGLGYEFCAFNEQSDQYPFCYANLVLKNSHAGVEFLDFEGRKYLNYLFGKSSIKTEELFIREIWYYHFTSEHGENEDYRLHFVFDEEGNVNYRKYDEKNQKIEDYESNRKFDISGLYEAYPAFGAYKSLIRLDRDLPLDILHHNPAS
ncbi:hypothetical protein OQX61_01645 [Pedobacter sp. PLR]|uniref:hypothetical protein n=1 Tax=Pedobacter sp. PLR TaxID=2994465 RepID=UPI002247642A|nr:hypothetical protein [Pedobacter sp. PLR]MCX2449962.1 hypothetical protein [Pedobacter sp. PLR]